MNDAKRFLTVYMIEVFKTNVRKKNEANKLIRQIHKTFINYQANFDLEDCDKILRVKFNTGFVQADPLINFIKSLGFNAEVLPDNIEAEVS